MQSDIKEKERELNNLQKEINRARGGTQTSGFGMN
jgi:hypothetical protein